MIPHSEIKLILPHRHPMLLVDAVLAIEPGSRVAAIKNISRSEPCFDRLGPDAGDEAYAYPASLIIESFCQSAGILKILSDREQAPAADSVMLFGSMSNVRFHGDAFAGERLTHEVRLDAALTDAAVFSGEVRSGERLVATIERVVVAVRPASAVGAPTDAEPLGVPVPAGVGGRS
jgi:3-hydroxyacyl-[acyl-carrier-protein] dehydratase